MLPGDLLTVIFLLFCFKGKLNENLLQFLIHEIDTELFKSIFLIISHPIPQILAFTSERGKEREGEGERGK